MKRDAGQLPKPHYFAPRAKLSAGAEHLPRRTHSRKIRTLYRKCKHTLAVVAPTLLIAALFNPLRRSIQSFIDRRFYRRKYDARKALEAYSLKLRNETDLEALNDELVSVVTETMQPAHVSLWLHPATLPKSNESD